MKSSIIIIGAIVALSIAVAGAVYFIGNNPFITEAPPQDTTPSGQPATSEEPSLPEGVESPTEPSPLTFEQSMEKLNQAIAEVCTAGERREMVMVITEVEANNKAVELIATAEIPADIPLEIESARVDFQPDNSMLVEAESVLYGKLKATIKATVRVSVEAGEPEVEIIKINFGFVPLPQSLGERVVDLITGRINERRNQLVEGESSCDGKVNLEFKDISIGQDDLTATIVIERVSSPIP